VAQVDRFGNLVTDIPSAWLDEGVPFEARVGPHRTARRASHYAELAPGEAAVVPGSLATLELSIRDASLAESWQVRRGAVVDILLQRK
jgi:S-adenosylmethionine hydrolase